MRQKCFAGGGRRRREGGISGQIPDKWVIAEELKGNVIDLEGHQLMAVGLGHTDTDYTTRLHVPSLGLVVAGDAAYNDVDLYFAESNAQKRQEGIAVLGKIESRRPRALVASHKRPENDNLPELLKRRGGTSAISTGGQKRRKPLKNSTTRCCNSIRAGSMPVGRNGLRRALLSRE